MGHYLAPLKTNLFHIAIKLWGLKNMQKQQPFGNLSEEKSRKTKKESLERLQNSLEQAKTNGDTAQARMLKAIIDRIKADLK